MDLPTLQRISNVIILTAVFSVVYAIYCFVRLVRGWKGGVSWRLTVLPALLVSVSWGIVFYVFPRMVDSNLNRVKGSTFNPISEEVLQLHSQLWVADLHADSLLWPQRDLLSRLGWGHVDLPRLQEGNVALQVFSIVTGIPANMNFDSNPEPSLLRDSMTLKVIAERWGWPSVASRAQRTLFQARSLFHLAQRSNGLISVITNQSTLWNYVQRRDKLISSFGQTAIPQQERITSGLLSIEGLHAMDDDIANINIFFEAGIRMMSVSHFFDNSLGGSAAGLNKIGLTELGREVIRKMNHYKIIIDIAHSSKKTIDDILQMTTQPVLSSHTGVNAVCLSPRNLDDYHIIGIAKSGTNSSHSSTHQDFYSSGGLIGIAYFEPAICGPDSLGSIVDSIRHVADLVGVDHVALGSDYDGAVTVDFDTSKLAILTNALLTRGKFTLQQVSAIMGINIRNFLAANLPV